MIDYTDLLDRYYPLDRPIRDILIRHSRSVYEKALEIKRKLGLALPEDDIVTAGMLHDIGVIKTNAPGIDCYGSSPYLMHGLEGARMILEAGIDPIFADVAKKHTGAGITNDDIVKYSLPLPPGEYMPESLLERLICYADKFFSKSGDMKEKSLERVRQSMLKHSPETAERFELLHKEFSR